MEGSPKAKHLIIEEMYKLIANSNTNIDPQRFDKHELELCFSSILGMQLDQINGKAIELSENINKLKEESSKKVKEEYTQIISALNIQNQIQHLSSNLTTDSNYLKRQLSKIEDILAQLKQEKIGTMTQPQNDEILIASEKIFDLPKILLNSIKAKDYFFTFQLLQEYKTKIQDKICKWVFFPQIDFEISKLTEILIEEIFNELKTNYSDNLLNVYCELVENKENQDFILMQILESSFHEEIEHDIANNCDNEQLNTLIKVCQGLIKLHPKIQFIKKSNAANNLFKSKVIMDWELHKYWITWNSIKSFLESPGCFIHLSSVIEIIQNACQILYENGIDIFENLNSMLEQITIKYLKLQLTNIRDMFLDMLEDMESNSKINITNHEEKPIGGMPEQIASRDIFKVLSTNIFICLSRLQKFILSFSLKVIVKEMLNFIMEISKILVKFSFNSTNLLCEHPKLTEEKCSLLKDYCDVVTKYLIELIEKCLGIQIPEEKRDIMIQIYELLKH